MLQVPLQDSQHCFIWREILCETDAQLSIHFIPLAPVAGSYLIRQTESCKKMSKTDVCAKTKQLSISWLSLSISGPAGNTAIERLQLRSGGEHSSTELAVRVRRDTLRSSACSWGPAGKTLGPADRITHSDPGLAVRSGGEHCDRALAVEVRQRRRRRRRRRRRDSWHRI